MSDIDRLRAAADFLADLDEDDAPASHATAALLRAIADADRDLTDGVPSCITTPALALAEAILPTPHCCGDWECGFTTPPDRDHCGCFEQVTHPFGACQRQGRKRDGTLSEVGEQ